MYILYIFQRSTFNLETETKAFFKKNIWFNPYKKPDLLTADSFFKLIYTSKKCT